MIVVFCATIPWRVSSCEQMLDSLAGQTVRPDRVILHLDGFAESDPSPRIPPGLSVEVRRLFPTQGVGCRWRSLSAEFKSDLVLGVDDDFVYGRDYCAETVAASSKYGSVSWHGWSIDWRNMCFPHVVAKATQLVRMGTAFLCCPGDSLVGVEDHPLADKFFAVDGHEEALISFWLWSKKIKVTRPPGRASIVKHHELGTDPRSTSIAYRSRKAELRRFLLREFSWPGGQR